jgi:hypothetical protein
VPDDDYLTVREFAALSSDAQQAVWRANAEGRVAWIPASDSSPKGMRRYRRTHVSWLLRELEESRG